MPFPKLMHCHDKPTVSEMVVIHKEFFQNLAIISLPFGNNHDGFLCIMMLEALYIQCFDNPFQLSLNPGEYPNNISAKMFTK